MASTARTSTPGIAADQILKFNDQLVEIGSKVGNLYLDSYEKTVADVAEFQKKLADQSKIEGVQSVVNAQVELVSDLTKATTAATRKVLA
jgi:hypothetical protein